MTFLTRTVYMCGELLPVAARTLLFSLGAAAHQLRELCDAASPVRGRQGVSFSPLCRPRAPPFLLQRIRYVTFLI